MSYSHLRRRDLTVDFSRVGVANVDWTANDCRRISVKNLKTDQVQNLFTVIVCENCRDPVPNSIIVQSVGLMLEQYNTKLNCWSEKTCSAVGNAADCDRN